MNGSESWLRFARDDLHMAELALKDGLHNQVCFHAQQCAEKSLKAWLVHNDESVPRTHRMADLLTLVSADFLDEALEDRLLLLDRFYIPTRYPDALPGSLPDGLPEEKDALEALEVAKDILRSIERQLLRGENKSQPDLTSNDLGR